MKHSNSYNGEPLAMKLPLRVELESDVGVLAIKDVNDVTIFRTLNGTDARYLVDAVNSFASVRIAKRDALIDMKHFVRGYLVDRHIGSFGTACQDIIDELTQRIERLRR